MNFQNNIFGIYSRFVHHNKKVQCFMTEKKIVKLTICITLKTKYINNTVRITCACQFSGYYLINLTTRLTSPTRQNNDNSRQLIILNGRQNKYYGLLLSKLVYQKCKSSLPKKHKKSLNNVFNICGYITKTCKRSTYMLNSTGIFLFYGTQTDVLPTDLERAFERLYH